MLKHCTRIAGLELWCPWTPGREVLLEPDQRLAARPFRSSLIADGIPYTSFAVDDVRAEFEGLGVRFVQPPTDLGEVVTAVFDDTCGNLIQIASQPA